ncbi:MAG: HDIG domain-containing protein [Desulforhabdus sp.]|jgi:putative nucleotidyltransferase with HDIG domain|nr:HDIG domain-containing protein [Desulforhabdus sp.]
MAIPTRSECLVLMKRARMPLNIQRHSILVTETALFLSKLLNRNGAKLNLSLVEAGGLLHDIAKAQSLFSGGRHERLGAKLVHDWGFLRLASIVQDHVSLDLIRLNGPITESLMVNYADKRVKHDQIVTLQERFVDLIDRYAKSPKHEVQLRQKFHQYSLLEQRIFEHLTIKPDARELMQLSVRIAGDNGGEV